MDCIFCKIIEGDLPSYKIYEDKRALAFLDINPVSKGHIVVVPKEHYLNMFDVPPDILKDLVVVSQKLAKISTEALGIKGYNFTVNNGRVAGQVIDHLHFHIIPRSEGDNLHLWPGKAFTNEEMRRTADTIKSLTNN